MRKLLLAVCALVLTAGLLYGGNKWYMKRSAERWFEMYLTELGYAEEFKKADKAGEKKEEQDGK